MAYVLSLVTYKDFAGVSQSFRAWIDTAATPNVVIPGETLFDHLGNTLSLDIGFGVGALKTVAMTADQVIGYDDHDAPITAGSNRPVMMGSVGRDAAPTAVTDTRLVRAWYDLIGRLQTVATDRAASGTPTYGVVTVDTTATGVVIKAANAKRSRIRLINHGTTDVFVGFDTSLSAANGACLVGVKGASLPIGTTAQIRGITASSSALVGYYEEVLA